ncbi:hypothetical protein KGQ71_02310 [Patescibacteria group bacterium]|nr:hypothetical protein [Patescibacteria group bacterium]
MSLLDSHIAPYLIILSAFVILTGFFRRLLVKVIIVLILELILFTFYPWLLVEIGNLIGTIRGALG